MDEYPYMFLSEDLWRVRGPRNEVFEPYVMIFRSAYLCDFLFMDYSARPHRESLVDKFFESGDTEGIRLSGQE